MVGQNHYVPGGIQMLGFHVLQGLFLLFIFIMVSKSCVIHIEEGSSYSLEALFLLEHAVL